jgi:hypothetical protein
MGNEFLEDVGSGCVIGFDPIRGQNIDIAAQDADKEGVLVEGEREVHAGST